MGGLRVLGYINDVTDWDRNVLTSSWDLWSGEAICRESGLEISSLRE